MMSPLTMYQVTSSVRMRSCEVHVLLADCTHVQL